VLLFDASHEHNQKQKEQQQANNLALLIYHQRQLLRKLEATYQAAKKEQTKSEQIYFGATNKAVEEQHTPQATQSSADTSLLVVNNLFDYVKSNLGEITLYFNRCDIRHILANLKTLFTPSTLQKETVFSVETLEPMPKWLICDELYLQQALINLITQMMTLFVYSTVQLTLSWQENRLEFVLAGRSGSSLAALTPSSISTNVVYNTNLMLSRHLIERMGGELTVESTSEHQTIYRGFIIASSAD
jgi:signal transduction histidine kinase